LQGDVQVRLLIASVALLLPLAGRCEPVGLNFSSVPVAQFVQATYKAMLHRDVVMSPEVLAMDKPITVAVRSIDAAALPKFIDGVLNSQGIKSVEHDGVYFLSASSGDGASSPGGTAFALSSGYAPRNVASGQVDRVPVAGDTGLPAGLAAGQLSRADAGLDDDRLVFLPKNRKADFIVSAVNASYSSKPAQAAGGAVIISGPKERLQKMRELCEAIDLISHKVKVSATFVEVATNEGSSLGVSLVGNVLGAQLGVRVGDTSNGALSLRGSSFQLVLDALASDGRFKQVSSPTAWVDDNDKANISFGDDVPTISGTSLDKNGNPIQQVTYQSSGVLLDVTPRVLGSGKINITLDGSVSSFSPTTTGVSGSPTRTKRQVQTTVTVDDGELLVIGGLNSDKAADSGSRFSFLPKAWAARSRSRSNTDLVLILSATVVR
jgi:type II secretory pathway component GspD/PulD (secretin)